MNKVLTIYCDGGSRGNPGPAAAAFAVLEKEKVIVGKSKYLGEKTNNFAEYKATFMAVSWIKNNLTAIDQDKITINVDSELVKKQLSGEYKIKSKTLLPIYRAIKKIDKSVSKKIIYQWQPRDQNTIADSLVNEELDKQAISRRPKK